MRFSFEGFGGYCTKGGGASSGITPEGLHAWRCAVFVTFLVTYIILAILAVILYGYHRWQKNLQKRLFEQDVEHQRNTSSANRSRRSDIGTAKGGVNSGDPKVRAQSNITLEKDFQRPQDTLESFKKPEMSQEEQEKQE